MDNLFSNWNSDRTPGCALGVVRGGRLIHCTAYGVRDIDNPVPIDVKTPFDIGSEAKQFTGAAVLLLANDNAVDLNAEIHEYIPDLPDYGHRVTVDHLVHHTSGLPDYYDRMMEAGRFGKPCTLSQVFEFLRNEARLEFAPGETFRYSNSGYALLAILVERVAGISFAQFVDHRLFRSAGMTASFVSDVPSCNIPGMARGHDFTSESGYVHREFTNYAVPGPGSLWSTVSDLGRWVDALQNSQSELFSLGQKMLTPGILNSGEKTRYGFGLDWGQCFTPPDGMSVVTHSGSHAGFCSVILRLPDQDLSVILLCNTRNIDHNRMVFSVANIFLNLKLPDLFSGG